jgi:hypothetical protein
VKSRTGATKAQVKRPATWLKSSSAVSILLAVGAAVYLYCFVFSPPLVPIFNNQGDCIWYLAQAQRMVHGEMIYRDFFELVPPGIVVINAFLFKLFGLRPWVPSLEVTLLGGGLVWLGGEISRKMMRPYLALLPSALFLLDVRQYLLDPIHHWYSSLAAIAGIAVLLERRTPARIAAAGFFCGLSAFFTQTRGAAAVMGFVLFFWWESRQRPDGRREFWKNSAWLAVSFVLTLLVLNGYFVWEASPARFLWCTVVFLIKYYPQQADWNTWRCLTPYMALFSAARHSFHAAFGAVRLLPDLVGVPCIFIIFFVRYWRKADKENRKLWERPMLVAVVGLFLFLSVLPAPAPNRVMAGSLPAFILLGWLLDSKSKAARALVAVCGVLAIVGTAYSVARYRPKVIGVLTTPHGRLAFSEGNENVYHEYAWVQQHSHPGEYFYEAAYSDINFYFDLRNPTPMPLVVNNGYTTPRQVADVIQGLESHQPRYILWSRAGLDVISDWENPSDAHLGPLRDYVHSHYVLANVLDGPEGKDEIWERIAQKMADSRSRPQSQP